MDFGSINSGSNPGLPAMKIKRIVLAFIENTEGQILLTKRSEKEKILSGEWYIPGGHCEKDELFLDCLERELKEELGVNVKNIINEVGPIFKEAYDSKYEIKIYRLQLEENKFILDKGEISETLWVSPTQLTMYVESKSILEYYSYLNKDN